jgi:hypothetical protein
MSRTAGDPEKLKEANEAMKEGNKACVLRPSAAAVGAVGEPDATPSTAL